ncbi:MAG: hypothetical protein IPN33_19075 [Saprospiraceae bacterium]|nr:hypothetical protein [Saprospiraceae bacterium]
MENSYLIAVLKSLNKKEQRELRKWLDSPVHNQREDVALLFDYLTTGDHLDNEKYLRKEKIYAKIFGAEPMDDAKLRQTVHFLTKAVEEYLIVQDLVEDELHSRITLAGVYRKRKLDKPMQRALKNAQEAITAFPYRDDQYFRNDYLFQLELYTSMEGKQRTTQMNLQEVSDALELTFIIEKLRQTCRMLSHQAVYKAGYDTGLLEAVLDYVEQHNKLAVPAIAIYYYIYRANLQKDNPQHFEQLKQQIQQHGQVFPHSELREIYLMALNYCIGKMNAGETAFVREAFELYRRGFEMGILIENQIVSRWTFLNVILIGLRLKEFAWAGTFIKQYQQFLEPRYRENFVHYCQARLLYEQKKYKEAQRLLVQVEYDDMLINLNAKSMLLKMFYEEEELDALESLLESMRTYLQRKEVIGYHKANYQNIIRYTKKLLRVTPRNKEQKEKLRQEIQHANPLTEKEWLLEMLSNV